MGSGFVALLFGGEVSHFPSCTNVEAVILRVKFEDYGYNIRKCYYVLLLLKTWFTTQ